MRSALLLTVAGLVTAPLVLIGSPDVGASASHAPVHVPDVVHMTKSAVYDAMARAGLYFRTQGPGSANGRWLSAVGVSPRAGTVVPWHSTVTVTTSLHVAITPGRVPNVVGLDRAQVNAAMAKADLFYTTRGPGSASGTWVRVATETPRAGTVVPTRSTIALITSTHRARAASEAPTRVRVPGVRTMDRAQVNAAMAKADLFYTTSGPGSASGTWVRVVAETPRAGTLVAARSTIRLTTSLRRPVVAPSHAAVRVPNVVHMTRSQVTRIFNKDGLRFRTQGPGSASGTWVRVVAETPRAGTLVAWHAVVVLTTARPAPSTTTSSTTTPTSITTTSLPGSTTSVTSSTTTTTTVAPSTTTTLRKTRTAPVRPRRFRVGVATWYRYFPGRCATSYLPKGTRITVRDLATGRSVHCLVTDREGAGSNRVVDLSQTQFRQLAPLWRGVVRVKVSW